MDYSVHIKPTEDNPVVVSYRIERVDREQAVGAYLIFCNGVREPIFVDDDWLDRFNPQEGGYYAMLANGTQIYGELVPVTQSQLPDEHLRMRCLELAHDIGHHSERVVLRAKDYLDFLLGKELSDGQD